MDRQVTCEVCGAFTADGPIPLSLHWRREHGVPLDRAAADARKLFGEIDSKIKRVEQAAPALLEACEFVMGCLHPDPETNPLVLATNRAVAEKKLRAAIALAKGEE